MTPRRVLFVLARDPLAVRTGRTAVLETAVQSLVDAGHEVTVAAVASGDPGTWMGLPLHRVSPPGLAALPFRVVAGTARLHALNEAVLNGAGVRRAVAALAADAPNVVWAVDFQFDADEHGRPIKICSIVDEHTRECIGGLVERSITADRLTAHLEDLVAARGAPAVLRSDNGPEFISEAMADWAGTRTGLSYIPPGSPWRNGYVESFNSRIRDECLNINSFYSLLHAQVIIGDWKDEYNHHRRHSSLGYLTPAEYARQCTHQMETDDSQNVRTECRERLMCTPDFVARRELKRCRVGRAKV